MLCRGSLGRVQAKRSRPGTEPSWYRRVPRNEASPYQPERAPHWLVLVDCNVLTNSAGGATECSPARQRWVGFARALEPQRGDRFPASTSFGSAGLIILP